MDERDFFIEARAQRMATLNCPFCRSVNEYSLTWLFRKKRTNINLNQLDERDRAKFEKAQSYMVLLDDHANCLEPGCRRHFEISGVKTMAFVTPEQLEEVSFGGGGQRDPGGRPRRDTGYRQPASGGGRREDYGNRQPQGDRGNRQYGQGGQYSQGGQYGQGGQSGRQQGGNAPGNRGGRQGSRGGSPSQQQPSPSQWNDQQGPRGPRGKRSDPTGPGGGWR